MDDYLSEREQWETIKLWVRENGLWVVAGLAVGAAGLGGYRWYQQYRDRIEEQTGIKYEHMAEAFERGDRSQGFVLLGELERENTSSPYLNQAKLMAARAYVESGELEKASTELQAVSAQSGDPELALIARLRLARVQIAQKKPDDALSTLNGVQAGAFESRFHEVRGDAYYAKGDNASALKEYLSAKTADIGGIPGDSQLDLKISDLSGAAAAHNAQAPKSPPTAATSK